mmetsp:Transcript_12959/g.21178  ORF Transcript_12959/g.21178 Transcript_12959/m.21178 type:complete len:183 (+) Transcript_12959:181-729(+)
MGVASSIPYDIRTETNHYPDSNRWELYDGRKNDGAGDETVDNENRDVSIFSFKKSSNPEELVQLALAQKGCQRLKSLIHPYILGFIDSTEVGDSYLMVTERATPIGEWLRTIRPETDSCDLEILWGLKCILEALHFLHSKCHIAHCNVSTLSCFYTKNGDWKLGALDLACACVFAYVLLGNI